MLYSLEHDVVGLGHPSSDGLESMHPSAGAMEIYGYLL